MSVPILQKDDKILRQKSAEVPVGEITSPKIKKIIANMKEAMHSQDDAVAIAAPQIGVPLCIFIVSGRTFQIIRKRGGKLKAENEEEKGEGKNGSDDQIFINPKIVKVSKETKLMEEGCLSVRYLYGQVRRSTKAIVEAYNENGEKIKRGGSGLLAQIFQHETEHLAGKLFIDKAVDVIDLPPDKIAEWQKKNGRPNIE